MDWVFGMTDSFDRNAQAKKGKEVRPSQGN
jgi:hypothetical protein